MRKYKIVLIIVVILILVAFILELINPQFVNIISESKIEQIIIEESFYGFDEVYVKSYEIAEEDIEEVKSLIVNTDFKIFGGGRKPTTGEYNLYRIRIKTDDNYLVLDFTRSQPRYYIESEKKFRSFGFGIFYYRKYKDFIDKLCKIL